MDAPKNNNTLVIVLLALVFVSGSGLFCCGGGAGSPFRRSSKPVRPGDGRRPETTFDKSASVRTTTMCIGSIDPAMPFWGLKGR